MNNCYIQITKRFVSKYLDKLFFICTAYLYYFKGVKIFHSGGHYADKEDI